MCEWGNTRQVWVKIPADLSATGEIRWKSEAIDSCIAGLVWALQGGGVDMRGSCCGHGKDFGRISLQDGRVLVIMDECLYDRSWKLVLACIVRAIRHSARSARHQLSYWVYKIRKGVGR